MSERKAMRYQQCLLIYSLKIREVSVLKILTDRILAWIFSTFWTSRCEKNSFFRTVRILAILTNTQYIIILFWS